MHMRSILITTFLCSGLIAGVVATQNAIAYGGAVYAPNSDWAISKIPASQPGAEPYCALARRFSNNMVLTLARNASDESSLAIDFQQTAFSNERDYRVTFMPGFDQDRAFDVRPVSGKAIVVRMGNDPTFFDALNRSGRLSLDIGGEAFAFGMPDMMRGQREMERCIASLIEPASGGYASGIAAGEEGDHIRMPAVPASPVDIELAQNDAPPPPAYGTPAPTGADSTAQMAGQLEALREDNMRLRNALEAERRNYEDRLMREGSGSSAVAELNEKVRILENENGELRRKVSDTLAMQSQPVEAAAPLSCPIQPQTSPEVQAELTRLQEENKMLREAQGSAGASDAELTALRDESRRLQDELTSQRAKTAALEKQLSHAASESSSGGDAAELAAIKARVSELETENSMLRQSLKAAETAGAAEGVITLSQLRSVEAQLSAVEEDRNKLVKQVEAMRTGKGDDLMSISAQNWNLEQATRRYNEAEREIQRLSRMVEEQRATCAKDKKALEYMLFDPEIATEEQISKVIKLEENAKQAQAVLDKQKKGFEDRIALLEKDMAGKDRAMVAAQDKVALLEARIEKESAKKSAEYSAEVAGLRNERDAATKQVEALKSEAVALKAETQTLKTQLAGLQTQIASLETTVKSGPTPAELEAAQSQISALKADLQQAQQHAAAEQAALAAGERDMLNRKIAALEDELNQMRVTVRQSPSVAEYEQLKSERDGLASQMEGMAESLASIAPAAGTPAQEIAVAPVPQRHVIASVPQAQIPRPPQDSAWATPPQQQAEAPQIEVQDGFAPVPLSRPVKAAPAPVVSYQPAREVAAAAPVVYEPAPAPAAPVYAGSGNDGGEIQSILRNAGLSITGTVRATPGANGSASYSWEAGNNLYGSGETQAAGRTGSFGSFIQSYLTKTRGRCNGEFAAVPGGEEAPGALSVSSYEIACIGAGASAAVSVVFFDRDGKFTAIAHETGLDSMDLAMDARDRLLGLLSGGARLAMR